jgi:hypothetical protein
MKNKLLQSIRGFTDRGVVLTPLKLEIFAFLIIKKRAYLKYDEIAELIDEAKHRERRDKLVKQSLFYLEKIRLINIIKGESRHIEIELISNNGEAFTETDHPMIYHNSMSKEKKLRKKFYVLIKSAINDKEDIFIGPFLTEKECKLLVGYLFSMQKKINELADKIIPLTK